MENYISIYNWLRGLGFPETTKQFADLIKIKMVKEIQKKHSVMEH